VSELENGLQDEMRKRIVDDFLDFMVLRELEKRPLGCYDVISLLHNKHDMQLSSGKTYSRLFSLKEKVWCGAG